MKIDLENKYFHGLAGGIPFWEEDEVVKEGLKELNDIIKLKGIYSRRILEEKGIMYDKKAPVYNGEDYISVCMKNFDESEFSQFSNLDPDPAFYRYVRHKIGIALELEEDMLRKGEYEHLPGERQVKDSIDISKFVAITVGMESRFDRQKVAKTIKNMLNYLGIYTIPITDTEGEILEPIKSIEKDEEWER